MPKFEVPRTTFAGKRVRSQLAERLLGVSDEEQWVALLLAHELVNNAFEHGRGRIIVYVSVDAGTLHVGVSDESSEQPELGKPRPYDERGKGLYFVDQLATSWGVRDGPSPGKTVWFDLQLAVDRKDLVEARDLEQSSN